MRSEKLTVAIDGPVAAGKTTVGDLVARKLGAVAFDTGILYRAVAHAVVRDGLDPADADVVAGLATNLDVKIQPASKDDGRSQDVLVDGEDVTWGLRTPEVDRVLPPVSANPGVREALLETQRQIGRSGRVVMIGRDIGTVILPDADFKFFIDAPMPERARRRHQELVERGVEISYEDVLRDLEARDRVDSSRTVAPLKPAHDAVRIDTNGRTAEDVAEIIVETVRAGCRRSHDDTNARP